MFSRQRVDQFKDDNIASTQSARQHKDATDLVYQAEVLFSIPPHQFLFNAGSIDKKSYMDMLQLDDAEYNLIKFPQRGVCLYKCGNERYLLEVHAPPYKEKLFGTAGGR